MPLPKGGGIFALCGLLNQVGHLPEDGGAGGTWGQREADSANKKSAPLLGRS